MAMELYNALSPAQQAVVLKSMYDEAKGAVKGIVSLSRGAVKSKKRKKKVKRLRREMALMRYEAPQMARGYVRKDPMAAIEYPMRRFDRGAGSIMAGNALTTPMRSSYSSVLQRYKVVHKEYVAEVDGSSAFTPISYRINPANPILFPWLSRIAPNFERYKFKTLVFCVKTQTSTTTPGSIMLAIDYDPVDPLPATKTALMQYEGAIRGAAWDNVSTIADKKEIDKELLTAEFEPASDADARLSDMGQLILATAGQTGTDVISELWVEYEVELIVPQAGPMCAEEEVKYSHVGVLASDVASGGIHIMSGLAPIASTYCYGISYTSLATGSFDIYLDSVTTDIITANGNITVNGVSSSADHSMSSLTGLYSAIAAKNVTIYAGDAVEVAFDEADEALFGYVRLRVTKVDPSVTT
jgi:hypothetical protein